MAETTVQASLKELGSQQTQGAGNLIESANGPGISRFALLKALGTAAAKTALAGALMVGTAPAQDPQNPVASAGTAAGPAPTEKSAPEAIKLFNLLAGVHNKAQQAGDFEAVRTAAAEWNEFLKSHPNDPLVAQAHHYRGVCLLQLKDYAEAARHFSSAAEGSLAPEVREEALFNRGLAHYLGAPSNKELFKDAGAAFEVYLQKFPKGRAADRATFCHAESMYQLGNRDAALESYAALLSNFPESSLRADTRYLLGVAQQEANRVDEALATLIEFVKQHPEHKLTTEANLRRADLSFQKGDLEGAAVLYAGVCGVQGFEHADYAGMRRAACLAQLGRYEEAAAAFEDVATSFPQSPLLTEAQLSAGRLLVRVDKLSEAAGVLEQLVGGGSKHAAEAGYLLAQIALRQADPTRALERAEAALRVVSHAPQLEVPLKMARADALYALPDRRGEANAAYLELFEQNRDHAQAPQALYKAASGKMESGEYVDALKLAREFSSIFKDHPLNAAAQFVAAESAIQTGDVRAAEQVYVELIQVNPRHPDLELWRLRLARVQLQQHKNADVLATLTSTETIQSPELRAEAYYLVGRAHFASGAWSSAVTALSAASAAGTTWSEADAALFYLSRAQANHTGDPDSSSKVVASLSRLLEEFPASSFRDQALYQLGEQAVRRNDLKEAYERFNQVNQQHGTSSLAPYALYQRGVIRAREGKHQESEKLLSEFIATHEGHELAGAALYHRGLARRRSGDTAGAIVDLDAYLATPDAAAGVQRSNARFEKGLALVRQGRLPEATEVFRSVLTDDPGYVNADHVRYELAWAYRDQQQMDQALEQFNALVSNHPESRLAAEALYHVAEDHFSKDRLDQAAQAYARALEIPETQEDAALAEKVVYKLGWVNFRRQNYEAALEQFSRYLEKYPAGEFIPQAIFIKGETLFKLGRFGEAYPVFTEASNRAELTPQSRELSMFRAAESAAAQKMWKESREAFEQLLQGFPETSHRYEAHLGLGRALENTQDVPRAQAAYLAATRSDEVVGLQALVASGGLHLVGGNLDDALTQFDRAILRAQASEAVSPQELEQLYRAMLGKAGCLEAKAKRDTAGADERAAWSKESRKLYETVLAEGPEALKADAARALKEAP